MKRFASFLEKIGKNVVAGALCLVAAMLLFFSPGAVLHTVIKIAGILIMVTAVVRFLLLVKAYRSSPLPVIPVLNAVLLFALGTILFGMPGGTLRFIFAAIGIYLVINALLQVLGLLVTPAEMRGIVWWVDLIFTVVVFALGVWLLLSPGEAGRVTEIVAGVSLTVKGAELLLGALGGRSLKESKKNENGDIEADFVDKSNEP